MTKQEIFNNDIRWLAQKKRIERELNEIENLIKCYKDPNTNYFDRSVAANNISVRGGHIRTENMHLEAIEGELLSGFSYLNPDIVIEDYDSDPMY